MQQLINYEARTHKFSKEGVFQGEKVKGEFLAKYPSIMDELQVENILTKMLVGVDLENYPVEAYKTAYAMAYLEVVLIEYPDWFNLQQLDNRELLFSLFEEVATFVDTFRQGNKTVEHKGHSDSAKDSEVMEDK